MSGHSKWSTIKHKKGATDAKRGKIFTKLAKEITIAAKQGGGDVNMNARLRQAILAAKDENMPKDNIERAIKKGTGELGGGVNYEEVVYEGYGPGGVAVLIEVMTDNRNRTVAEVRHILSKHGGNLGENGCVGWMFEKKGNIVVSKTAIAEDVLLEIAMEAGADDVLDDGEFFEILSSPTLLETLHRAIEAQGIKIEQAQITMIPQNTVQLDESKAEQMLKLMEKLEDNDDVQNVYANFDIDDTLMERLTG